MDVKVVEAKNISKCWKFSHLISFIFAAISGISGGIALSALFQNESFVFGSPTISKTLDSPQFGQYVASINGSYYTLQVLTSGRTDSDSSFVQFSLVASFIFSSIWAVFFVMCGRGDTTTGLPQPWRIVLPALIFSSVFLIIVLAASILLTTSINSFCSEFRQQLLNLVPNDLVKSECSSLDDFIRLPGLDGTGVVSLLSLSEAMSWLCTISWTLEVSVCLWRMMTGPDFNRVLTEREVTSMIDPGASSSGYKTLTESPSFMSPSSTFTQADVHSTPSKVEILITGP